MLIGRFRCGSLLRHFYPHISWLCDLCGLEVEDLPHFVLPWCPLLQGALLNYAKETLAVSPVASTLFNNIYENKDDKKKLQFFLDPSSIPAVIAAEQIDEECLPMWCNTLNRLRTEIGPTWTDYY